MRRGEVRHEKRRRGGCGFRLARLQRRNEAAVKSGENAKGSGRRGGSAVWHERKPKSRVRCSTVPAPAPAGPTPTLNPCPTPTHQPQPLFSFSRAFQAPRDVSSWSLPTSPLHQSYYPLPTPSWPPSPSQLERSPSLLPLSCYTLLAAPPLGVNKTPDQTQFNYRFWLVFLGIFLERSFCSFRQPCLLANAKNL